MLTEKRLNSKLRKDAIKAGLCEQWQGEWKEDWDRQTMIEKYIKGLDFSIVNKWITNRFIRENFTREELHANNLYVDDEFDLVGDSGIYVFQGESEGSISFRSYKVATLHIRHSSSVKISAEGFAKLFVHMYEDASADISQTDGAKVFVYTHSDRVSVKTSGEVSLRKSHTYG